MKLYRIITLPEFTYLIPKRKLTKILDNALDSARLEAPKRTGNLRKSILYRMEDNDNKVRLYIDESYYGAEQFYAQFLQEVNTRTGKLYMGSTLNPDKDFMFWFKVINKFYEELIANLKQPLEKALKQRQSQLLSGGAMTLANMLLASKIGNEIKRITTGLFILPFEDTEDEEGNDDN